LEHTPEDEKRSRAIDPNNISMCFIRQEDYPQALQAATAATEEDKTFVDAWYGSSGPRRR